MFIQINTDKEPICSFVEDLYNNDIHDDGDDDEQGEEEEDDEEEEKYEGEGKEDEDDDDVIQEACSLLTKFTPFYGEINVEVVPDLIMVKLCIIISTKEIGS